MESRGRASTGHAGEERRRKPRIHEPFRARVRGIDWRGNPFEVEAVLDNVSASGLYMRVKRRMEAGARIFIFFRLATMLTPDAKGLGVAAQSRVLRSEPQPDGACGVAVAFERHHHL
jgi:hypothetical protein